MLLPADWARHDDARYLLGGLKERRASIALAVPFYQPTLRIAAVEFSKSLPWKDDTLFFFFKFFFEV